MKPPSAATTFRSIDGQFKVMVIENFHQIYFRIYIFNGCPVDADVNMRELLHNTNLQFNSILTEIIEDESQTDENINWDLSVYALNGCYSTKEYSGIFIASVLYFLVQECPIFVPSSRFKKRAIDGALPM